MRSYCIYAVLKDRRAIAQSCALWLRLWLVLVLLLRPLYADRKPEPHVGCLKVWLKRRALRRSPEGLLEVLSWIERRSRFDRLVADD